jgi:hypothetical protein
MPDISLPEQAKQVGRDELGRFRKARPAIRPGARRSRAMPQRGRPRCCSTGGRGARRKAVAPRRERSAPIALPAMRDASDIARIMAAVTAALAAGELTPGEAGEVARVVEIFMRAIEASAFEERLQALEASHKRRP